MSQGQPTPGAASLPNMFQNLENKEENWKLKFQNRLTPVRVIIGGIFALTASTSLYEYMRGSWDWRTESILSTTIPFGSVLKAWMPKSYKPFINWLAPENLTLVAPSTVASRGWSTRLAFALHPYRRMIPNIFVPGFVKRVWETKPHWKQLVLAVITTMVAYKLLTWVPAMVANKATIRGNLREDAMSVLVPRLRQTSMYTSRSPDLLIMLKSVAQKEMVENDDLKKLNLTQEERTRVIEEATMIAMIPTEHELEALKLFTKHRNPIWKMYNYMRGGKTEWWDVAGLFRLPK